MFMLILILLSLLMLTLLLMLILLLILILILLSIVVIQGRRGGERAGRDGAHAHEDPPPAESRALRFPLYLVKRVFTQSQVKIQLINGLRAARQQTAIFQLPTTMIITKTHSPAMIQARLAIQIIF